MNELIYLMMKETIRHGYALGSNPIKQLVFRK